MPTTSTPQGPNSGLDAHREFVLRVERLCREDKRARAELRRGLGRPFDQCQSMHRHLVKWNSNQASSTTRAARYAVAALIAAAPADARTAAGAPVPPNLGASLGQAVRRGAMKPSSAEATLHLLTRQQYTSVNRRLPALTRQIQRADTAIDWGRLSDDLARWDRARDRVATRWLESYYRAVQAPDPTEPGTEPDPEPDSEQ
ncbi:CRISPR-associated protein, Cse2 family [Glycomyces sambucus]|uniref:CRISPR-associated protein, Cse2 family n=1 Tax=Glycomyces sambucus TaxID=380244 RepID=A0A1G9CLZ0_9ACTN|nr:type I-E CRISPR-associated protein Cse2/CasB [Glycomyces sambucus]SDK52713.1 CRISPR-associated protein, Cse2 family [Glycomyces sambucus]